MVSFVRAVVQGAGTEVACPFGLDLVLMFLGHDVSLFSSKVRCFDGIVEGFIFLPSRNRLTCKP
jgi:hypothetical protein